MQSNGENTQIQLKVKAKRVRPKNEKKKNEIPLNENFKLKNNQIVCERESYERVFSLYMRERSLAMDDHPLSLQPAAFNLICSAGQSVVF